MNFRQLFLLGNPRSGTTMLRLILDCHSKITIPPECGFVTWLYPKYKNWSQVDLANGRVHQFLEDLSESRKFETWNSDTASIYDTINKYRPICYQHLVQCVYLTYGHDKTPQYLGDKNNYFVNHLEEIKAIFPNLYCIHLVRDGRDVASSYLELNHERSNDKYFPKLSKDIKAIAREWKENNLRIASSFSNSPRYHFVRYEDILRDPQPILSKLLSSLELEYEKQIMDFYLKNRTENREPSDLLRWKLKTLDPIDSGNMNKFRKNLSTQQIEAFEQEAGDCLALLGYDC